MGTIGTEDDGHKIPAIEHAKVETSSEMSHLINIRTPRITS
jgi:hypothetical protein